MALFRYSSPVIGGADSAIAVNSVSTGLEMTIVDAFSRLELWHKAAKSRWANPRQKTNVGGNGSCRNSEARVSKPRVVETENASPRCATVAWLSFGSA
jgi:hypothetical protein